MYNASNRSEVVNKNIVVSSIDRVKFSYQLKNSHIKGYPRNPLNEHFRTLRTVKNGRPLETGLYYAYINKNNEEYLVFVGCVPRDSTEKQIQERYQKIKKPVKKIKYNGLIYTYSYKKTLDHREYEITGYNQKIRITKNKNFFIFEINDIIQEKLNQSIFLSVRKAIQYLINTKVFNYAPHDISNYSSESKAYKILRYLKISEVEIAFDIINKYGKHFYDILSTEQHDKLNFVHYKNTIYWNNSYDQNKRWKWKYYNKSLKDRIDSGIITNDHEETDIYRFEITIGRNNQDKLSISDLKKKQSAIISILEDKTSKAFTHFFKFFEYDLLKQFIIDIKSTGTYIDVPNTTKREYIKLIKKLLLSRSIDTIL